jgi:hypothetical protein
MTEAQNTATAEKWNREESLKVRSYTHLTSLEGDYDNLEKAVMTQMFDFCVLSDFNLLTCDPSQAI